jgi:hypothetical protein
LLAESNDRIFLCVFADRSGVETSRLERKRKRRRRRTRREWRKRRKKTKEKVEEKRLASSRSSRIPYSSLVLE